MANLPRQHTSQSHKTIKKSVMKAIFEDIDVLIIIYWNLISQDIDDKGTWLNYHNISDVCFTILRTC